jgi:hypothetical protein
VPANLQGIGLSFLLTHRSFFVRAAIGIIIGAVIFFGTWAASLAWLPADFFLVLPRPSITGCEQNVAQALRAFLGNLVLTGGLTTFASLFVLNRFPLGYIVPWMMFAIYGGLLGTNSFNCPNPEGPLPVSLSVLWTRAGFREVVGYLLIAAVLANQFLWRQTSFFKLHIESVRSWKEFKINLEMIFGLCLAIFLLAWGAVVEMMPT